MTESIVEVTPRDVLEKARRLNSVAYAAFVQSPIGSSVLYSDVTLQSLTVSNEPDKMVIPAGFQDRVNLIRYFYELDPIANTVVDKIIDIGISRLLLDRNECDDDEYTVYSHCLDIFDHYLKEAALEYLLSGLVIPRVKWDAVTPDEVGVSKIRRFELPVESWVLNPSYIELKQIPLTDHTAVILVVPSEVRNFISKGGKLENGIEDTEALDIIKKQYPELAKKNPPSRILLKDTFVIRRRSRTYDPYPVPYLLSALESLMFKRNLKKMDYSIASRVISAIQLIKLGSDEYPLTEDDEDQLAELENTMLWRNTAKNIDRVFQLFSNHTLNIEWIYPDTEAMLNQEKYEAVNQDIFYALGFPRILLNGETIRSATSQAEFAMFSPAETIKRLREDILTWVEKLIDEVQKRNKLEHKVTPKFEELRLYDLSKFAEMIKMLFQSNALSLTSLAKSLGFDFEDEILMKDRERKLLAEYDLPEAQPVPFSPLAKSPRNNQGTQNEGNQGGDQNPK